MTTVAPSCAIWMAIPRPMPLSEPVTITTFESNCPILLLSFPLLLRQKTIRVFILLRRLRDWKCVLSTPLSRLPAVRQDVRRQRVRKGVSGDTPDPGRRLRPCTPTFTVNWQSPLRLIECARLLLIRDCLFPAQHDNPCPTLAPEGAKVGKEIRQEDLQTIPVADEVVD